MTFCLGMRVHDGLVGIADTRITSGNEVTTARKISLYHEADRPYFLMTSGLRSVRDKALAYYEEYLETSESVHTHLFQAVNALAAQIRRVADEDRAALKEADLAFDIHCLVGGQLSLDHTPRLYLLYPQGNWVEVGEGTPYQIVGVGGYGKPVLDRALRFSDSLRHALQVGFLSFDGTRIAAANVDFPIDVVVYSAADRRLIMRRFEKEELEHITQWYQERMRATVADMPNGWTDALFGAAAVVHGDPG